MTFLQAILLGIIQGLTEFLPVSSSAHLVLVPYLLGWEIPPEEAFVFNVLVQVASLIAVIVFFSQDLAEILKAAMRGLIQKSPFAEPAARQGWLLILATIPAGLVGLAIKDLVEQAFASPLAVAIFLLVTAGMLVLAENLGGLEKDLVEVNWKDALFIGLAQAIAIFPGVSRSGATITGGMLRGLKRPAAARFAFLMAIPIMLAAGLLAGKDLTEIAGFSRLLPVFLPGLLASAIVSYLSIRWLLAYLKKRRLYVFAAYCALLGLIIMVAYAMN